MSAANLYKCPHRDSHSGLPGPWPHRTDPLSEVYAAGKCGQCERSDSAPAAGAWLLNQVAVARWDVLELAELAEKRAAPARRGCSGTDGGPCERFTGARRPGSPDCGALGT